MAGRGNPYMDPLSGQIFANGPPLPPIVVVFPVDLTDLSSKPQEEMRFPLVLSLIGLALLELSAAAEYSICPNAGPPISCCKSPREIPPDGFPGISRYECDECDEGLLSLRARSSVDQSMCAKLARDWLIDPIRQHVGHAMSRTANLATNRS
eukprot:jgi/Picre1/31769/NNA_007119.t1